jgi:tetraacyldisaccharide 4'-kinase
MMVDIFMVNTQKIIDIMEGKRRGKSILHALSYLYRGGVALRNFAYDHQWLKSSPAPLPIISVGNIVAGGTGKTPFVKFLAEQLFEIGPVAILSRGYRSLAEKRGQNVRVDGATDVRMCGDEPYWLAKELPQALVWVGKNRLVSAVQAKITGATCALLDDGMQHRQLQRDFEIVLMNGDDLWGKGFFLPRGFLRDSPHRLKDADLIAVMGEGPHLEEELRKWTDAPVVYFQRKTNMKLVGKKVAVFCAIASPERFLQTVRLAGGDVVKVHFKSDHDTFSAHEVQTLARGADLAVCTEKDFVKLPADVSLPVAPLPCYLEITGNLAAWDEMIKKIQQRVRA